MTKNFTPIDLIAYLYGESTPAQTSATESALAADPVLADELDDMVVAQSALPRVKFNAPKRVLRSILGHSEESHQCLCC